MLKRSLLVRLSATLLPSALAQVITITQYPSSCTAIYPNGSSTTTVSPTITLYPTTISDKQANGGTPFVIQVVEGLGTAIFDLSTRSSSTTVWLMGNGNTTETGADAQQYVIQNGTLAGVDGGFISTNDGTENQPFALILSEESITQSFDVTYGVLNWTNVAFDQGQAELWQVPPNQLNNSEVIARFSGPIGNDWAPLKLIVRALGVALNPKSQTSGTPASQTASSRGASSLPSNTISSTASPIGPITLPSKSSLPSTSIAQSSGVTASSSPNSSAPSISVVPGTSLPSSSSASTSLTASTIPSMSTSTFASMSASTFASMSASTIASMSASTSPSTTISTSPSGSSASVTSASLIASSSSAVATSISSTATSKLPISATSSTVASTSLMQFSSSIAATGTYSISGSSTTSTDMSTSNTATSIIATGTSTMSDSSSSVPIVTIPSSVPAISTTSMSSSSVPIVTVPSSFPAIPTASSSSSSSIPIVTVPSSVPTITTASSSSSVPIVTVPSSVPAVLTTTASSSSSVPIVTVPSSVPTISTTPVSASSTPPTASASASSTSIGGYTTSTITPTSLANLILPTPTPCVFANEPSTTSQDDSYCSIAAPSPVVMYNASGSTIFASTNGIVSLFNASTEYQVQPLPDANLPVYSVAPFFDDLYIFSNASNAQGIYYEFFPTSLFIEFYLGRAGGDPNDIYHFLFEYVYTNPGVFSFHYYAVGSESQNNGIDAAVGIQGLDSSSSTFVGNMWSYRAADIYAGNQIRCQTTNNYCYNDTAIV